jgi:hypothetical protein
VQVKGIAVHGGWPVGQFGVPLALVLEGAWVNVGLVSLHSLCRAEGGETPTAWIDPQWIDVSESGVSESGKPADDPVDGRGSPSRTGAD